jgi:hypothetical protein
MAAMQKRVAECDSILEEKNNELLAAKDDAIKYKVQFDEREGSNRLLEE